MVGGSGNIWRIVPFLRVVLWGSWFADQILKWSDCVVYKEDFLMFGCQRWRQTPGNCVVSPVHTMSAVGKLQFLLEKTKGYMSGMSTLLSFLLLQWARFFPFEMQNQNVFNFWDSLSRYLETTQAWPATSWENSSDFNSAGPPSSPCGH